jgi:lipopolysaccharide/colanic/teichoic acid biosynthesis glycosyltransferase
MYKRTFKRVLDVCLSIIFLAVFAPVIVIVAIAIKLESKGPILADVPDRVGLNGKSFKLFKFRSMIQNAHVLLRTDPKFKELYEHYKKSSFKLHDDPRVTRVGKFIRKHSLDEIPQFLNVLRGEMSIVGPRAYYQDELDHQTAIYPEVKELVQQVLSVRPGITGLWQVSGRSEINFDKRIRIDAQYARHVSFLKDLEIMMRTPFVMITGKGAV